jgi:hypothetical protein
MSRVRKAQQTELTKLLKEINRRMGDFEDSVQKLKDLKECAVELDETIAQQASVNKNRMEELNKDFQDNKIRAINQAASELGKVVITKEELEELRFELDKVKESGKKEVADRIIDEKKHYDEKLAQSMNVLSLKHQAETARLQANMESHVKEVKNLNAALSRMAEELKSQKELTASVVAPRQQLVSTQH